MTRDVLFANGFEDAFMGVGIQFNKQIAVYNYDDCISILMERDGMSHEEAIEFFDFNVTGAYVGPHTPIFFMALSMNEIQERE